MRLHMYVLVITVVLNMFKMYESICFEYDDCDLVALKMASLFQIENTESYNTYIKTYEQQVVCVKYM